MAHKRLRVCTEFAERTLSELHKKIIYLFIRLFVYKMTSYFDFQMFIYIWE